jgi:hypothetical protein
MVMQMSSAFKQCPARNLNLLAMIHRHLALSRETALKFSIIYFEFFKGKVGEPMILPRIFGSVQFLQFPRGTGDAFLLWWCTLTKVAEVWAKIIAP